MALARIRYTFLVSSVRPLSVPRRNSVWVRMWKWFKGLF